MPKKPPHVTASPSRLASNWEIQYARLLGMCIAAWAHAEEALTLILGFLLVVDHHKAEIVFYASKSEQFRVDLIRQLAKAAVLEDDLRKSLNEKLGSLISLVGKRNTYVRGLWGYGRSIKTTTTSLFQQRPARSIGLRREVTTKDLRAFFDEIQTLDQELLAVLGEMRWTSVQRSMRQSRGQTPSNDVRRRSKSGARRPRSRSSRE